MGGDDAPEVTVAGAVRATQTLGVRVLLVGDRTRVDAELARHPDAPAAIQVIHAEHVIGMDETPGPALLHKRGASIVIATDLIKEGRASAVVSAGNSGAAMGAAALRLGLLPGIDRPAIAMLLPSRTGAAVVLDGGATLDPRPENLRDFAWMGSIYAQSLLHIERPRVGLLNVGEEPTKGSALVKQTYALLKELPINFIGNIEGQHIAAGDVDVVVCDGFVGNAILKAIEGYAELFWTMLMERTGSDLRSRLGASLLRPALQGLARRFDYSAHGGALLAGVNGICVIAHGRSTPPAVENAIRVAKELSDQRVVEQLTSSSRRVAASSAPLAPDREQSSSGDRSH
jgi:glycerol-3-phosphate acyltransferase PlsX